MPAITARLRPDREHRNLVDAFVEGQRDSEGMEQWSNPLRDTQEFAAKREALRRAVIPDAPLTRREKRALARQKRRARGRRWGIDHGR
jgi:hypothetical protein